MNEATSRVVGRQGKSVGILTSMDFTDGSILGLNRLCCSDIDQQMKCVE